LIVELLPPVVGFHAVGYSDAYQDQSFSRWAMPVPELDKLTQLSRSVARILPRSLTSELILRLERRAPQRIWFCAFNGVISSSVCQRQRVSLADTRRFTMPLSCAGINQFPVPSNL
jgi:hypothetical protein